MFRDLNASIIASSVKLVAFSNVHSFEVTTIKDKLLETSRKKIMVEVRGKMVIGWRWREGYGWLKRTCMSVRSSYYSYSVFLRHVKELKIESVSGGDVEIVHTCPIRKFFRHHYHYCGSKDFRLSQKHTPSGEVAVVGSIQSGVVCPRTVISNHQTSLE